MDEVVLPESLSHLLTPKETAFFEGETPSLPELRRILLDLASTRESSQDYQGAAMYAQNGIDSLRDVLELPDSSGDRVIQAARKTLEALKAGQSTVVLDATATLKGLQIAFAVMERVLDYPGFAEAYVALNEDRRLALAKDVIAAVKTAAVRAVLSPGGGDE